MSEPQRATSKDRGAVLPLVLIVSVVLGLVVAAIATYATTTLRYGQVVEASSDRVAAAEGGLDWVLDRYDRGLTQCDSGTGAETLTFPDVINGLSPQVTCTLVGDGLPAASSYALVLTGEDLPAVDPRALLSRSGANSEAKEINGPIFMEDTTFDLSAPLELNNGWLLHHDDSCTGSFVESSPTLPAQFTIGPPGQPYCTNQTWRDMFDPNRPIIDLPTNIAPAPQPDPNGCVIWQPGVYNGTNVPDFDSSFGGGPTYNYFISGNYYFDDIGEMSLKGSYVLAGYPGIRGPNIVKVQPQDTFDNHPCREAWWYDGFNPAVDPTKPFGDRLGATWYLGGSSWIDVEANSAIEISGRPQAFRNTNSSSRVSLQTIDPTDTGGTAVRGEGEIITTQGGSGSQMAMRGLVWTPNSTFNFDNLANDVVAALQGGAVVSTVEVGAAAQTDGFLIEVSGQPFETQLQIESTATNSGTVTVRAIVDYQPSPADVTIISRRVTDVTPE
jgi:hypothetical protein